LPDIAVCGGAVVISANPAYTIFARFESERVSAVPAIDFSSKRTAAHIVSAWLFPCGKYLLSRFEDRFFNDRLVRSTDVILLFFTKISGGSERQRIGGKPLLQQLVADVSLVSQYAADRAVPPDLVANALRVKPHRNLIHADPAHIPIEYLFYDFGFLGIDPQFTADIVITERGRGVFIGAVHHAFFDSHAAVSGYRHGFLLGELAVYRQHHFRADLAGVDIFFFKIYRYAERFQLAHRLEAVFGVSGEPGYGFREYPIDLSLAAVAHQPLKLGSLCRRRSGYALIFSHSEYSFYSDDLDLLRGVAKEFGVKL